MIILPLFSGITMEVLTRDLLSFQFMNMNTTDTTIANILTNITLEDGRSC